MSSMTHSGVDRRITVGVDTHADVHVAVALDQLGVRLGHVKVPTTRVGYGELERWATDFGPVDRFGVEGTGSYGAELSRLLRRHGHRVIEVNRPDRATRRRLGKSDTIDAEAAARAVLAGVAKATPKDADGNAEMLRMLKIAKDSAVKARTQAVNQIRAILVTAPGQLRESLAGLSLTKLLNQCTAFEPAALLTTPLAAAQHTLQVLAQRTLNLIAEDRSLTKHIKQLATRTAPALMAVHGVGPDSAATILLAAGDNPHRMHSEAAFAALCGVSPIPASSGKTDRVRLNRGGNRQANASLHRIAVVRLRWHEPTQKYMARRLTEGKPKTEIMRCLKRYIARDIYKIICPEPHQNTAPQPA